MNQREFTAIYQKRGGHYIAWIEEVPGVNTQGKTKKETQENLREALLLILEANRQISVSKEQNNQLPISREPLHVGVPSRT